DFDKARTAAIEATAYFTRSILEASGTNAQSVCVFMRKTSETDGECPIAIANLTVSSRHGEPFPPDAFSFYALSVSNSGPNSEAGPIRLSDALPGGLGMTFITWTGEGWECAPTASGFDCVHQGPLAAAAQLPDLSVTVRVPKSVC